MGIASRCREHREAKPEGIPVNFDVALLDRVAL